MTVKRFTFLGIDIIVDPNMPRGEARVVSLTTDPAGRTRKFDEVRIINLDPAATPAKDPPR